MGSTVHRRSCPKDRERVKFHPGFFVILILIYAFIVLVLFDCQVDFDVDNIQHRELVNFDGV